MTSAQVSDLLDHTGKSLYVWCMRRNDSYTCNTLFSHCFVNPSLLPSWNWIMWCIGNFDFIFKWEEAFKFFTWTFKFKVNLLQYFHFNQHTHMRFLLIRMKLLIIPDVKIMYRTSYALVLIFIKLIFFMFIITWKLRNIIYLLKCFLTYKQTIL